MKSMALIWSVHNSKGYPDSSLFNLLMFPSLICLASSFSSKNNTLPLIMVSLPTIYCATGIRPRSGHLTAAVSKEPFSPRGREDIYTRTVAAVQHGLRILSRQRWKKRWHQRKEDQEQPQRECFHPRLPFLRSGNALRPLLVFFSPTPWTHLVPFKHTCSAFTFCYNILLVQSLNLYVLLGRMFQNIP